MLTVSGPQDKNQTKRKGERSQPCSKHDVQQEQMQY